MTLTSGGEFGFPGEHVLSSQTFAQKDYFTAG